MNKQQAIETLQKTPSSRQRLTRSNFDFQADVAGQRTKIGSFETDNPIAFREGDIRLMLTVHEQFTTDGSADNTETFNVANDLMSTVNTEDLIIFEGGDRVRPDSVDADADSFDYTDDGTGNDLDVFYVARDPVQIEIVKSAPRAQNKVSEVMFDGVTAMIHSRNQVQDAPELEFSRELEPVVPTDWTVDIYAEGPVAQAFEANGVEAVNAIIDLPIKRTNRSIDGLAQAVKQDIIDPN